MTPIWFHYSFKCPLCGETVNSGSELISVNSREQTATEVLKRHPECPHCHKPFPPGRIPLSVTESYSMNV